MLFILYVCVAKVKVTDQKKDKDQVNLNANGNGKREDNNPNPDQLSMDVNSLNLIEVSDEGKVNGYKAQTFTFDELAAATGNFRSDCFLGEGGFGKVYKGHIEKINQVR